MFSPPFWKKNRVDKEDVVTKAVARRNITVQIRKRVLPNANVIDDSSTTGVDDIDSTTQDGSTGTNTTASTDDESDVNPPEADEATTAEMSRVWPPMDFYSNSAGPWGVYGPDALTPVDGTNSDGPKVPADKSTESTKASKFVHLATKNQQIID